ncbi:tryptophan synthase subunit alpha [Vagococcus fluvialis]|uniref:tryptophan synthase subunit alpha n=1 Tax=Vagococcus fluvialis TaxID=2738 RepID=UPI003B5A4D8C
MNNLAIFTVWNYPTKEDFYQILDNLDEQGVGFVEIGIPVTNPYVDGDLIQEAHKKVIDTGLTASDLEEDLKLIKERYSFKVILMTYKEGVELFDIDKLSHTLYDGIICVDQVLEASQFNSPVYIFNEDLTNQELENFLISDSQFNYVMSGRGKTGSFDSVPSEYIKTIKRINQIKSQSKNFIGFGIKSKEDIMNVIENGADGAIIGTAFIQIFLDKGIKGINEYLKSLK